jgi:hypothetical protein
MSLNLANLQGPWLTPRDLTRYEGDSGVDIGLAHWDLTRSTKGSQRFPGTRDFIHFWFYSAVAAPFVAFTLACGIHPLYGFAMANGLLMLVAFWLALPRLGHWLTWLVFAGPTIWWIDKAHTEVFTFSLLAIALMLVDQAPAWSFVLAGAAATQNLPIAVVIPVTLGALLVRRPALRRSRHVWLGAMAGLAIASLPVVYGEVRYGEPSLLLNVARRSWPRAAELFAVPFDTNIGLVANAPTLALAVVLAIIAVSRSPRRWLAPDMLVGLLVLPVFLIAFAQTTNVHHGGTPAMSRYAVWLIPLALPLLREFNAIATRRWMVPVAVMTIPSVLVYAFVFHPKALDHSRQPTWLAQWLWQQHPSVDNPLPEIFAEILGRYDGELTLPQATEGCTKVLLGVRKNQEGKWPIPCFPAVLPGKCAFPGAFCYANRTPSGYDFVSRPSDGYRSNPEQTWRPEAEPIVRAIMEELDWKTLRAPGDPARSVVRRAVNIDWMRSFEAEDRVLVILQGIHEGATLSLRLPVAMAGAFIDPNTGARIREESVPPSTRNPTQVVMPSDSPLQLLVLRRGGKPD